MGVIIRQGLVSSILIYIGMVLGFVISVVLFPITLGKEVYGFTQWIVYTSYTLSVFSLFGLNSVTVKYFPYFRDRENGHQGFLTLLLALTTLGLAVVIALIFALKPVILELFRDPRSENFANAYFFLIPLSLLIVNYTEVLKSYCSALFRPRVPVFFAQVVSRLLTLGLIGLFYYGLLDTDGFIKLFAVKNIVSVGGLLLFLYFIGELHLRWGGAILRHRLAQDMARFGLYAIFAQIGNQIIFRIDVLMVGPMLNFGQGGIYTVFVLIASVILLPHEGIYAITSPLIAESFKNRDLTRVKELYRRTALNNFILAVLLFVGIWANLDNAILLLGPEYEAGKMVALFLGLAQMINVMNGYNDLIVIHSQYYRFDLVVRLITCAVTIVTNLIFIRIYGMVGAAAATALTIIVVNIVNQTFVYRKFHMHPFSWGTLRTLGAGAAALIAGLLFPRFDYHFIVDILLRSTLIVAVYGALVLGLRISPDINDLLANLPAKVSRWKR